MSSNKLNTIYTVTMRNHNLHTTLQGSKADIRGILTALLATGWRIASVARVTGSTGES